MNKKLLSLVVLISVLIVTAYAGYKALEGIDSDIFDVTWDANE